MSIASGPIIQIAWVTTDLAATEQFLTDHFAAGVWTRLEGIHFSADDCLYRGQPADFVADISIAYADQMQLQLIRPVSWQSICAASVASGVGGLHHVCFETDDIELTCKAAEAAGIEVVQRGTMAGGTMEFAYVDGAAWGVPYVEIARIGPEMKSFFETLKDAR